MRRPGSRGAPAWPRHTAPTSPRQHAACIWPTQQPTQQKLRCVRRRDSRLLTRITGAVATAATCRPGSWRTCTAATYDAYSPRQHAACV
jgi:hypothetical protein